LLAPLRAALEHLYELRQKRRSAPYEGYALPQRLGCAQPDEALSVMGLAAAAQRNQPAYDVVLCLAFLMGSAHGRGVRHLEEAAARELLAGYGDDLSAKILSILEEGG
jgi:hypothetical protein